MIERPSLEDRLAALEQRVAVQDSYMRLIRWALPIAVAIAGIVIGRLV